MKKHGEKSFFGGWYGFFGSSSRRKKKRKHSQTIGRFNLLGFNVRRT